MEIYEYNSEPNFLYAFIALMIAIILSILVAIGFCIFENYKTQKNIVNNIKKKEKRLLIYSNEY